MKLMVLDGNSIANRAFYGIKLLSTKDGQYTNAIYGFVTILLRLMDEEAPDSLCVTFDRHAPTFRHLAFADYKANRHGMPDELREQMPILKDVLSAMNIPMYELDGWEADDLIGTISRRCEAEQWECVIVTGDKDALQLITQHTTVKLVTTRMGKTITRNMTPDTFQKEYGFEPKKLIDLKALMGDSSDNYSGVKGIGEKSAMNLIQTYGSIEQLYAHFDEIQLKPAQRKRLDEGRQAAKLSYTLATIRCDAPIEFHAEDNRCREVQNERLYELFCRLEFNKLISRLHLTAPSASASSVAPSIQSNNTHSSMDTETDNHTEPDVRILLPFDAESLYALLDKWKQCEQVQILTTPDLSVVAVDGLTEQENGKTICIGAVVLQSAFEAQKYQDFLQILFSDAVKKVTHRAKELMNLLLSKGLSTDGFVFDTALGAYLLNPTAGSYEISALCQSDCGFTLPAPSYLEEGAFSPLKSQQELYQVAWVMLRYAAGIGALRKQMLPKLQEYGMMELYTTIELPLCSVLAEMERAGVLVDREALQDFGKKLTEGINLAQHDVYTSAGMEFNINSTKQLGEVLFDKLHLPTAKKTKRGYSTNADVLEKLRGLHPIIDNILQYRQLSKLSSTYVDGLTREIAEDGRIHTNFQNTVTATGRLSSAEPNLQNIPIRTELGAEIRKMFIAAADCVLIDADYSQIELRLLAHMSQDSAMIEQFRTGGDIHTLTASQVYGVPLEMVTKQMRSSSKAINFGMVYGISAFSLSQDLHISVAEAKDYMNRYFSTFSGVQRYLQSIVEQAKENGYAVTLQGRRRWLPELRSTNFNLRSFGERVAMNMPIQGTAADIIKLAMVRVQNRLKAEGLQGRLVLQVHDELIVECPKAEAEQVAQLVEQEMQHVLSLTVPLLAEAQIGHSWSDAH